MYNVNGYCPHCKTSLDGELVIDYPRNEGRSEEECLNYAKFYSGWDEHGVENRWCRAIAIYSIERDRTTKYMCPDCKQEWDR